MRFLIQPIIFLLTVSCLMAQEILPLRLNTLEPRVGEDVEVIITIDFLTETIDSQLATHSGINIINKGYQRMNNHVERTIQFENAGQQQIGPFTFSYNGKEYATDSLLVAVQPKLPEMSGVWLRHVVNDSRHYIIVESLNLRPKKRQKEGNEGVSLDEKRLPCLNLWLTQSFRNSLNGYNYSKMVYTVSYQSECSSTLINADKLIGVPKGVELEPLLVAF